MYLALGELGTLMTTGQRVLPKVALDGEYQFRFPRLESALRSILFADMPASEVLS